ncbi:bifunctional metallophosphatase/5'-nucleotidase [Lentilactobacillus kosonis]|uniref:5'-nucleotidase n=1 Tax=Lentilactobacillus kosonis TaxID=2810561 RepID=A0A401FJ96_9LACO|nr:bifunctional metallophosphatase/5'-nucleotidase [Lentilactobacillus kosonis]GAY72397.1 5'-nucleotidase [Lentilactobacillus kosonis]
MVNHVKGKVLSLLSVPAILLGLMSVVPAATEAADTPQTLTNVAGSDDYAKPGLQPEFQTVPKKYRNDIPVQILGINDLHGGLSTTGDVGIGQKTYKGAGTAARLASYLDQAQNQFKAVANSNNTFRVEAGDMVGAAPANSSLLAHESTMHALKEMRFQIGTLGNHEFDRGLPEFNRILNGNAPTASTNASQLVKDYPHYSTNMQLIVANVVNQSNGQIPFGYKPYTIKTVKAGNEKAKVGFIGIDTSTLPSLTLYDNYKDYKVLDEAETIAKYDKILNNKGVKAVVVMAHTGVATSPQGQTTGPVVDILNKLNSIDPSNHVGLYVAGHSHQYANAKIGKTHVVQAVYTGKAYDDVWTYVSPKSGKFVSVAPHVYPVLSQADDPTVSGNPNVAAVVKDADNRVDPQVNQVIGKAATPETITGRLHNNSTMENAAGEVVVDGQLYEANKHGVQADFAMTNTGGVRADLEVNENADITWGAATAVQPFGNILQVVKMTGKQIEDALNQQYDQNQQYYLQIAGLKYTYTDSGDANQPFKVVSMTKDDGTPITPDGTYNVVINDFLHGGGDDFTAFKDTAIQGSIGTDTDTFVNYIKDMTAAGTPVQAPQLDRKVYQGN